MTVKDLLALVQEYDALWQQYGGIALLAARDGGIPGNTNPKVTGYFEQLAAIEKQITDQGFVLWHDGEQNICLYLPGKTPPLEEP